MLYIIDRDRYGAGDGSSLITGRGGGEGVFPNPIPRFLVLDAKEAPFCTVVLEDVMVAADFQAIDGICWLKLPVEGVEEPPPPPGTRIWERFMLEENGLILVGLEFVDVGLLVTGPNMVGLEFVDVGLVVTGPNMVGFHPVGLMDGLSCVAFGKDKEDADPIKMAIGQLDSVLFVPRRPPDSKLDTFYFHVYALGPESQPEAILGNQNCLLVILYPHVTQIQSLRDLFFCLPTDGPDVDRFIVALDAWGCLPFIGSGKGIKGGAGLVSVDRWLRYFVLFLPLIF